MLAVARVTGFAVVFGAVLLYVGTVAAETVAPEPFFKHADFRSLRISPSGKYLGALVPADGRVRLAIIDLESRSVAVAAAVDGYDINWFEWVNDDRLVFAVVDMQAGLGVQTGDGLFAVNRDGTYFRVLAPTWQEQYNRRERFYRYTWLLSVLNDGSDDILVVNNDGDAEVQNLYRLNTRTGKKTLKSPGMPGDISLWVADRNGVLRAVGAIEKGTTYRVFWRPSEEATWVLLAEMNHLAVNFMPIAFDGDGTLIVSSSVGRNTRALYRYDTEKKALGEPIAAHPQVDLDSGSLVVDRGRNRIVGVTYQADRPGTAWFEEDMARVQGTIDASLPGRRNVITPAGKRALVFSYSDTDPGSYYLFDAEARKLEQLVAVRRAIRPEAMPTRQPVHYAARDGLDIPAYLTLPRGKEPKSLPLVVLVHGGPWVHGATWQWSAEPAYLASLGYAVLEPEFRGSTGWGNKLRAGGIKQWGRAMQDDLDDGMDWLARKGTIDPKRACIMGASYGGYAVMMGLARTPDRWRCGINYFGVTDINLFFDISWADYSYGDFIRYAAKDVIGDPDKDAAMLKAASPLENAARIKAPVLMAYGAQDRRVPLVHGEKMRNALKAAGTPVEWNVYVGEGHGLMLEPNRYDFYGRVAKFLAQHLGTN